VRLGIGAGDADTGAGDADTGAGDADTGAGDANTGAGITGVGCAAGTGGIGVYKEADGGAAAGMTDDAGVVLGATTGIRTDEGGRTEPTPSVGVAIGVSSIVASGSYAATGLTTGRLTGA